MQHKLGKMPMGLSRAALLPAVILIDHRSSRELEVTMAVNGYSSCSVDDPLAAH